MIVNGFCCLGFFQDKIKQRVALYVLIVDFVKVVNYVIYYITQKSLKEISCDFQCYFLIMF